MILLMRLTALPWILGIGLLAGSVSADCPELLQNNEFTSGILSPWVTETPGNFARVSATVTSDQYRTLQLQISAHSLPEESDVLLSQSGFGLVAGEWYRLSFWAAASAQNTSFPARVKVGDMPPPYSAYGVDEDIVIRWNNYAGSDHSFTFQAPVTDSTVGVVFYLGSESGTLLIDSIFLEHVSAPSCEDGSGGSGGSPGSGGASSGGGGSPSSGGTSGSGGSPSSGGTSSGSGGASPIVGAKLFVNQHGYVPEGSKVATVVHHSTTPLPWALLSSAREVLTRGETIVSGLDARSGDHVHLLDFSAHRREGEGLRLQIGDTESSAFSIEARLYESLRRDAARFFYHQRASTAISAPYAEGSQYVRAAGHLDTSVSCWTGACSHSLDVRRGWYDAGDYGKYVVNGGIAAWTLMNAYERALYQGEPRSWLDDSLNIPESGNSIPDLLDEVRWQMEFLLAMQVPTGRSLAGMVHHKVAGTDWPPIPQLPSTDSTGRRLSAPSTAATLNLAATAAQCARVFEEVDSSFAERCLNAARTAYAAARANPSRYAVSGDADDAGSGAYDDSDVSDEFYWAAAELYATTGESSFWEDLSQSKYHLAPEGVFNWQKTDGLGLVSLAVVTDHLSSERRRAVRQALITLARDFAERSGRGYGSAAEDYVWGSNSEVLNRGLVQALAFDWTREREFLVGAIGSLDYVLGRNPLGQSYVSGYGVKPFERPHHRFWAYGYSSSSPKPPPGVIAGGPNRNLDGVTSPGSLVGCAPSKCWRDNASDYGLTEVTINWNAPLVWLAAWANENEDFDRVEDGTGGAPSGGEDGSGGRRPGGRPSEELPEEGLGGRGSQEDTGSDGEAETSGCGCSTVGRAAAPHASWVGLLLVLAWGLRRISPSRPSSRS